MGNLLRAVNLPGAYSNQCEVLAVGGAPFGLEAEGLQRRRLESLVVRNAEQVVVGKHVG